MAIRATSRHDVGRASTQSERDEVLLTSANPAMAETLALTRELAASDTTVTLFGETGTGKEVLARYLHDRSPRRGRPFVAVNCGALADTLVESELFGHERGAFSGAVERRLGYFEAAHRGTLLLDEVSELPMAQQTRLLRVLQEREVQRVGSNRPIPVDVRVIATTNRDLAQLVARGGFRRDLYYRLNVFPLTVPPLRQRIEDLPGLVATLLGQLDAADMRLTPAALSRLRAHAWPGNVRELRNVLERALVVARGDAIDAPDLQLTQPAATCSTGATGPLLGPGETLSDLERRAILHVLTACDGNRTRASARLGISVRTLRNRLRDYRVDGIPVPTPRSVPG